MRRKGLIMLCAALTSCGHADKPAPAPAVDHELQQYLVSSADFPGDGWTVRSMGPDEMSAAPDDMKTSPPECEAANHMLSSLAGVGAGGFRDSPHSVVMVALTKDVGKINPPDGWLDSCGDFTVTMPQGDGTAHIVRETPPASDTTNAIGFTMTMRLDVKDSAPGRYSDFNDWTLILYSARKGGVGVVALTIGAGGKPDKPDMDAVYQKQIAKLP